MTSKPPQNSPDQATSLTLIDGLRQKEAAAWDRLIEIYAPVVMSWGADKGLSTDACEDIAQEVFLSVSLSISRFVSRQDKPSFRPWLWTIFTRRWADWHRREHARSRYPIDEIADLSEASEDEGEAADGEPNQEDSQLLVLRGALEVLRSEFPKTFDAAYKVLVEGRSIAAVAAEADRSRESVKQAVYRLRKRLRELLTGAELPISHVEGTTEGQF